MKFFLIAVLFLCQQTFSQQIEGIVLNGEDNSKLIAASVFINNSTKGTATDANGKFIIGGLTETNFELVISYTGFVTVSIDITPQNVKQFHTVKLFPRKQMMEEVSVIGPEKDGWQTWGKLFTESFIGMSDFASECTIQNPEVLRFYRDKKASVLHAYSNEALIIHNKALGYNIKYQLEDFSYDSKKKMIAYIGFTGFEDMVTKNRNKMSKWIRNRHETYEGSILYFMRALYQDSIGAKGFEVHEKIRIYATDSVFAQIYRNGNIPHFVTVDNKKYIAKPPAANAFKKIPEYIDLIDTAVFSFKNTTSFDAVKKQRTLFFENYLQVIYKNAFEKDDYMRQNFYPPGLKIPQSSDMILLTDSPLIIEENGLYFSPVNLLMSGYWGWQKMAETLPSDYIDK